MQVWLLHIGEDFPVDGPTRSYRFGYLAQALQDKGHEVLRWAPTFRHNTKRQRFSADARVAITRRYDIQFVHSPGYQRNASLERLRTYRVLGRRFPQLAERERPPDLIVAAIPSLEWAKAATDYGRAHRTPVVIDVRDLWPDVFLNALPGPAKRTGRFALAPYYRLARQACQRADAITAVSQSYLDWALHLAGRSRQPHDSLAPLGFEPAPVPEETLQDKVAELRARGIDPERPTCMFAGSFERSYDLTTVIGAARRLRAAGRRDVQFVLCGDGSTLPACQRLAAGLDNVHLLGWVDAATLRAVASISSIGLCAYAHDALQSLPNKPFEYMAGHLATVSSLSGDLAALLEQHDCGVTYRAGDAEYLACSLRRLVDNPARLQTLCSNGYNAWRRNFRSSTIYSRYVDHLTALTTSTARAA